MSEIKAEIRTGDPVPLAESAGLTDDADERWADEEFARALAAHGKTNCPTCGRVIDRGDVAWNSASTEAGTGYSTAYIHCQACGAEVASWSSWWSEVSDWCEFCAQLLPGWES